MKMNTYLQINDMIYTVTGKREYTKENGDSNYTQYDLALVCGYDYVPYQEHQGWVSYHNFVANVQSEIVSHFYESETIEYALNQYGMKVVEELPTIYDTNGNTIETIDYDYFIEY